jgi:hypothetical protein
VVIKIRIREWISSRLFADELACLLTAEIQLEALHMKDLNELSVLQNRAAHYLNSPLALDLINRIKSQKSEIAVAISLCNMAAKL